jgi:HEAT repeat protein
MARRKEFEGRMLAILDPELRHSMPGRKQSYALIGSLAVIAILVGAAAPAPRSLEAKPRVATQPNSVDPQFTPQDPAIPKKYDRDIDRDIDKAVKKSIDKSVNQSLRKSVNESVNQSVDATVSHAIENSVRLGTRIAVGTITSQAETISDRAIEKLSEALGGAGVRLPGATQDERPALLANVLRTDSDASLRRTAAWGLSEYADTRVAVEALSDAVRKDSDAGVREMAAWALADGNGNSTAVAALSSAIRSDANESVRATAVWALGNIGHGDSYDALVSALSDKSKGVQVRAIWAIGSIEPRTAPKPLVAMLKDADPNVREITAWALYQIEDPSTVGALNDALRAESNKNLQFAYIRALATMGEKSVDAVRGLLTSSDPKIKSMAVRALAGGNAAGPWPWPWPHPRPNP